MIRAEAMSVSPGMTRYVVSPGSSEGNGSWSGRKTPVAATMVTVAVDSSLS
jgi:hypothetical protein